MLFLMHDDNTAFRSTRRCFLALSLTELFHAAARHTLRAATGRAR